MPSLFRAMALFGLMVALASPVFAQSADPPLTDGQLHESEVVAEKPVKRLPSVLADTLRLTVVGERLQLYDTTGTGYATVVFEDGSRGFVDVDAFARDRGFYRARTARSRMRAWLVRAEEEQAEAARDEQRRQERRAEAAERRKRQMEKRKTEASERRQRAEWRTAELKKLRAAGLPLAIELAIPTGPNSADGVGMRAYATVLSNKPIKYVTLDADAYNRVGDKVGGSIRASARRSFRVTGPLTDDGDLKEWEWDPAWYNNSITCVKLARVRVEYMDGSTYTYARELPRLIVTPFENDCSSLAQTGIRAN